MSGKVFPPGIAEWMAEHGRAQYGFCFAHGDKTPRSVRTIRNAKGEYERVQIYCGRCEAGW